MRQPYLYWGELEANGSWKKTESVNEDTKTSVLSPKSSGTRLAQYENAVKKMSARYLSHCVQV